MLDAVHVGEVHLRELACDRGRGRRGEGDSLEGGQARAGRGRRGGAQGRADGEVEVAEDHGERACKKDVVEWKERKRRARGSEWSVGRLDRNSLGLTADALVTTAKQLTTTIQVTASESATKRETPPSCLSRLSPRRNRGDSSAPPSTAQVPLKRRLGLPGTVHAASTCARGARG